MSETTQLETYWLIAVINLVCTIIIPHFPSVVKALYNFGSILDVTLCNLLVQSESTYWSNALLQVAVDNCSHVTFSQLKL